ncbi:MAG: type II toxin-antitoxin system Phd/YefM family antitoxin [Niameybacter sp.]|uniref:type II toxin-antitoxin system Phd/YefM family antitoxin n=1 Tax=Niameybacter sp. TaxID=2033640 RepID=UPI002FC87ABB
MNTITVTNARQNLYQLVNETNLSHTPIQIMGKQGSAVLLSYDDWKAIEETLFLTNIPGMVDSIRLGREATIEECVSIDEVEW